MSPSDKSPPKACQRTKMDDGRDPLSQSMPTWGLKNMKKKAADVEKSDEVKCVYDARIYSNNQGQTDVATDDEDYFKAMSNGIINEAEDDEVVRLFLRDLLNVSNIFCAIPGEKDYQHEKADEKGQLQGFSQCQL